MIEGGGSPRCVNISAQVWTYSNTDSEGLGTSGGFPFRRNSVLTLRPYTRKKKRKPALRSRAMSFLHKHECRAAQTPPRTHWAAAKPENSETHARGHMAGGGIMGSRERENYAEIMRKNAGKCENYAGIMRSFSKAKDRKNDPKEENKSRK